MRLSQTGFNPKLVRLEVLNMVACRKFWLGFNPKLVRLEASYSPWTTEQIRTRFNPKLVRLEVNEGSPTVRVFCEFQSQTGSIRRASIVFVKNVP